MKEDFFITGTALNNSIFPISLFIFFRVTKQLGIRARTVQRKCDIVMETKCVTCIEVVDLANK